MLAQEAVNTAAQLTAAILIAVFAWALAGRRRGGFFRFAGLYSPGASGWRAAALATVLFVPATVGLFLTPQLRALATGESTVAGAIARDGLSMQVIAVIALVALVKTALAEEIVFRGVIAKTLIRWFTFWPGAVLHAIVFGAVHGLIFIVPGGPTFSPFGAAAIMGLPALGALASVWINEKRAGGSILPGWLMHAVANAVAYPALAFL